MNHYMIGYLCFFWSFSIIANLLSYLNRGTRKIMTRGTSFKFVKKLTNNCNLPFTLLCEHLIVPKWQFQTCLALRQRQFEIYLTLPQRELQKILPSDPPPPPIHLTNRQHALISFLPAHKTVCPPALYACKT